MQSLSKDKLDPLPTMSKESGIFLTSWDNVS